MEGIDPRLEESGSESFSDHHMLFILISIAWLSVLALLVAVCRTAADDDSKSRSRAPSSVGPIAVRVSLSRSPPRPRRPRQRCQPAAVPAPDALVLLDDQRARTDEAHLAPDDVEQLGQLIQRGLAQEPAHARDARVLGDLEQPLLCLVAVAERVL